MNKEMTGRLIAQARKEKRMTQQELAEKLHITSKAVSKWETGVSSPDVGLLIPLSELLGLSVTELLEGERALTPEDRTPEQVEDIVKAAITYSEETPKRQQASRKAVLTYWLCAAVAALELLLLWLFDLPVFSPTGFASGQIANTVIGSFAFLPFTSLLIGAYGTFWAKERLPAYHDEYKIRGYIDGAFRMNVPGLYFNNRNWPYIRKAIRIWALVSSVLTFPLAVVIAAFFPDIYNGVGKYILAGIYLAGLFVPIYIVGRKFE